MGEYIDIVTKTGIFTGKIALKQDAHKNGWYHNTVHLWLYTQDGKVLLQQRSHKKTIYPLLWDVSVAGHIAAGESFTDAAVREAKEEIGLDLQPNNLTKIKTQRHESSYANGGIRDYEFHHVYIAELKVNLTQLNPQKNEVEALKLVSYKQFELLLQYSETNKHFIASNTKYYNFVIKTIKNHMNII